MLICCCLSEQIACVSSHTTIHFRGSRGSGKSEHLSSAGLVSRSSVRGGGAVDVGTQALQVVAEGGLVDGLQAAVAQRRGCVPVTGRVGKGALQQLAVLVHLPLARLQ